MMNSEQMRLYNEEMEKKSAEPQEREVAACLSNLIKYNPHLHHIDLQGCGLTSFILKEIAKALRKSRSLVGIHLSENIGLTAQMKEFIKMRVHCKDSEFKMLNVIDFKKLEKEIKEEDRDAMHQLMQESIMLRDIKARKRHE